MMILILIIVCGACSCLGAYTRAGYCCLPLSWGSFSWSLKLAVFTRLVVNSQDPLVYAPRAGAMYCHDQLLHGCWEFGFRSLCSCVRTRTLTHSAIFLAPWLVYMEVSGHQVPQREKPKSNFFYFAPPSLSPSFSSCLPPSLLPPLPFIFLFHSPFIFLFSSFHPFLSFILNLGSSTGAGTSPELHLQLLQVFFKSVSYMPLSWLPKPLIFMIQEVNSWLWVSVKKERDLLILRHTEQTFPLKKEHHESRSISRMDQSNAAEPSQACSCVRPPAASLLSPLLRMCPASHLLCMTIQSNVC